MSLIEFGGGEVALDDEWSGHGASTRNTTTKRTGTASVQGDLTVAGNDCRFHYAGGVFHYNTTVSGTGRKVWAYCAFRFDAMPIGGVPYGPIFQATSGGSQPATFGVKTDGGATYRLTLFDAVLNQVGQSTNTALAVNTWYLLLTEWDCQAGRVRAWFWDEVASSWDLEIEHSHGAPLWNDYAIFWWGWLSYKTGSMGCKPLTDDVWCNSDYDSGDGCNTRPAEPPRIHGLHPVSGAPTYDEWMGSPEATNKHLNWDDGASGGAADDGDSSYNESGAGTGVKSQTSHLENDIVGSDDILAVGFFAHYRIVSGANGTPYHLIRADGQDAVAAMDVSATYRSHSVFRTKTPAGNAWTESLLNGAEYGATRFAMSDPRNLRSTMIWLEAAKGTLESEAPPPPDEKHYGWLY